MKLYLYEECRLVMDQNVTESILHNYDIYVQTGSWSQPALLFLLIPYRKSYTHNHESCSLPLPPKKSYTVFNT